jgi:hypothetical protein
MSRIRDGFLAINSDAFPSDFAAGVPESVVHFMAISQVPISTEAFWREGHSCRLEREAELRCDCHTGPNDQP